MRYNLSYLESIAQGKKQLKTANQICEEIYGFNAFGFYNKTQPNSRRYFIKQMENYLHQDESTKNITHMMVTYIVNDMEKDQKKNRKEKLFDFMFNRHENRMAVLRSEFYSKMDKEGYSSEDKKDIMDFLSNPDKNNYLYQIYFRQFVIEFYSYQPNTSFKGEIRGDGVTSIYNSLVEYYSNPWEQIAQKVPNLIEDGHLKEPLLSANIMFTTGYHISEFKDSDEFHRMMYGEDIIFRECREFKNLKNCGGFYTVIDSDFNYCTTVGINYLELKHFLRQRYLKQYYPTLSSQNNLKFDVDFTFRAIYDGNGIKTVNYGINDSKSERSVIFLNILPTQKMSNEKSEIEISDNYIIVLVELAKWYDKDDNNGKGRFVDLSEGDNRNRPIVGYIPIRLLLLKHKTKIN